ncbi:uncharacterized protein [Eurosta solidaginis]|uniref:uncharacterized protein isoform X1 n=1 Tax=Eurosta solidaginis TaxID=178769 RepID=UPI003530EE16
MRTPPIVPVEINEDSSMNPFARRSRLAQSPPRSAPPISASSQRLSESEPVAEGGSDDENAFQCLGKLIKEMKEFVGSGKRTINQNLRDLVKAIAISYEQATDALKKTSNSCWEVKQSQTTPSLAQSVQQKSTKRGRECASGGTPSPQVRPKKKKNAQKTSEIVNAPTKEVTELVKEAEKGGAWATVKKQKRPKQRPARPDAILIKSSGDCSYADILKAVKNEESLREMNTMVRKIRKTAKGELLLQLSRQSDNDTAKLEAAVGQALSGKADVKSLKEESLCEIRDIDEVTTVEEVCQALNTQLACFNAKPSCVRSLRKAYGGTQTATMSLPTELVRELTRSGKVRIGWVICRVRAKVPPKRCFNCLEFGHIARNCGTESNLKGVCFKCGGQGREAKSCTNALKCLLCARRGFSCTDHDTGGYKCPVYKEAVQKQRPL